MTNIWFPQFLLAIFFLTIVLLHLSRKSIGAVRFYSLQSLSISAILFYFFLETGNLSLLFVSLITLFVKVILASLFFFKLIKKHGFKFSVSTYLNTPLTLIVIFALTALAHSSKFALLIAIIPAHQTALSLALSAIFLSLFLIINRKGAQSQVIGILSLENCIVAFAVFAGLEQSLILQIGIIFDILIWLVISTIFISMIYKHFGTLNVTSMSNLKE